MEAATCSPDARPGDAAPRPTLGARHVVAITIGIVIGAGIFRSPSLVAGASSSDAMFLALWLVGGLLSIVGALCYAELAAAFPSAGGDYHFLSRAFGRRFGFLYAWARLSVIQTGSLALLAYVFGDYAAAVAPLGPYGPSLYAAFAVLLVTTVNWVHVRTGTGSQLWLTLVEIAGLFAIVAAGVLVAPAAAPAAGPPPGDGAFGLALVFVLLTFGGWSEAVYASAEIKGGPRRIMPVLVGSLVFITLLYLAVNWAYLRVLGLGGIAASDAVGADLMRIAFGPTGAVVLSVFVAIAALTSANATAITGARTSWALGRNVPRLAWLGRWDAARETPGNALIAQSAVALALVLAGAVARNGFQLVVEYTAPVFWFFLLMVGVSLFVLRRREPQAARPFRVPLYPALPALFCATSAYLLYSSVAYTGASALVGVGVLAVGALLMPFLAIPADKEIDA